ncbi:hypothetical protein [Methylogaea oryzae]|uniref:hypothetical protein n=1 Tax=Methylogaea oryzae TaxID=1295382 RepID=UPI0006D0F4A5|nr:hypothetical protein [Methylogaea oryzae]
MPDASHNDAVLIFPAGMPRALEFLGQCRRQGRKALGASSLAYDPARQRYDRWLTLPYVTAADFDAALRRAVAEHGVTGIYTPHVVVWDYLNRRLADIAPGVALLNASPLDEELAAYRTALDAAPAFLSQPLPLASSLPAQPPQPEAEIAALLRHFAAIPGMCDLDKLKALYEIARRCPQGDVVEIGSWWGKSAFALLWLAQRYAIGKLLCVDPWENAQLLQHDADPLVDRLAADRLDATRPCASSRSICCPTAATTATTYAWAP